MGKDYVFLMGLSLIWKNQSTLLLTPINSGFFILFLYKNKKMLLGYHLLSTDARDRLYGDDFEFGPNPKDKCLKYRCIYDINYLPNNFKISRNAKSDFLITYEGINLVTKNVIEFCKKNRYTNIEFIRLPNDDRYYWMKPHADVEFDFKRRGTEFLWYSKKCKGYREIIGADPVCLKKNKPLGDNFYRTDLSFGSIDGKHPLILMGTETFNKIKKSGLRGAYFEKILDKYEWEK